MTSGIRCVYNISIPKGRNKGSGKLFFSSRRKCRRARTIASADWTRREIATPVHPVSRIQARIMYTVARARAALGYADERQIKMHNPGKSFRIFHNGREISLLAARAIHPFVQPPPRTPPLAQTPREFVGDRALRTHTNGWRDTGRDTRIHVRATRAARGRKRERHLLRVERGWKRNGSWGMERGLVG